MKTNKKGKFIVGKVQDFQKDKGWFFGSFAKEDLLRSGLVEVSFQNISKKTKNKEETHTHKKTVEINIVISGKVKMKINNKNYSVKKGGFYILWPYAIISNVEADDKTEVVVIRAPSIPKDKYFVKKNGKNK